jgi:hypothetical protein
VQLAEPRFPLAHMAMLLPLYLLDCTAGVPMTKGFAEAAGARAGVRPSFSVKSLEPGIILVMDVGVLRIWLDFEAQVVTEVEPASLLESLEHFARRSHHAQIDVLGRSRPGESKLEDEPALEGDGVAGDRARKRSKTSSWRRRAKSTPSVDADLSRCSSACLNARGVVNWRAVIAGPPPDCGHRALHQGELHPSP